MYTMNKLEDYPFDFSFYFVAWKPGLTGSSVWSLHILPASVQVLSGFIREPSLHVAMVLYKTPASVQLCLTCVTAVSVIVCTVYHKCKF